MDAVILAFRNKFAFLSNFFPCQVEYEGILYPSAEHAFQAAKTLDPKERHKIACAASPGMAKRMGRVAELRPFWNEIRVQVMRDILRKKFSDPELAERLVATDGMKLIEGNNWGDKFWGMVYNEQRKKYEGENWLGRVLMEIREEIQFLAVPDMPS